MNWTDGIKAAWGYRVGQTDDLVAEVYQNDGAYWRVELVRAEDDARTTVAVNWAEDMEAAKTAAEAVVADITA